MKRLILPILFLLLAVSAGYAEDNKAPRNSQTENPRTENSHIENPRFGDESRYKIVATPREIEADKNSQEKNPQYKKAAHQENAAVRKFNSSKIQKSNAVNLPDFLRGEGFFVMTTGGTGAQSQLSYKGYTSFCIKVYVDGILCNDSTTGEFDWNSIDINSIETIEIEDVPSLSEAEFAGCIVRITTKNGGDRLSASVSTGSFERSAFDIWNAKVLYSKEFEKANINFSSDVLFADNKFERTPLLGTNLYNFSRAGNAAFGWNVKLSEKFNLYGSDTFSYNFLKVGGYSLNTNLEEDIATRNNINLSYKNSDLKNEFKSDTSLFYNFGNVKFVNNLSTNNIDYTTFNKISVTENIKWVCDFTAGIDAEFIPARTEAVRMTEKIGVSKKFSFASFEIEPQLVVLFWQNAGKNDSGVGLLPRLTASYQGLTLAAFREFVLPTFNQLYWPDTSYASGNLNLKPEDGWSAFLGFRRDDFPIWAQYKFSYYQNKIRWGSESVSGAGGSGSGGSGSGTGGSGSGAGSSKM
uniref:TonB-dependent receptor plug domain-containing protein n=1 Tax=Treponema sp. TaxID=166 RepID=UPI00298E7ECF